MYFKEDSGPLIMSVPLEKQNDNASKIRVVF